MDLNVIIPYINLWLGLIILPIFSFNLLWRMLPIYLNGFVGSIYLNRPSHTTAVFGGLTALWACADWIRGYMMEQGAVTSINWYIAIGFGFYGIMALIVGLMKIGFLYGVLGRRTILTFFAISFYPIQTGHAVFSLEIVKVILIMAIPVIILFEVFAFIMRRFILKV